MAAADLVVATAARKRQRDFTVAGAWIVVVALLTVFVGRPQVQQWRARATEQRAARTELARLRQVVQAQPTLDSLSAQYEQALATRSQRVLRARSRALAASALQSLVQEMAEASNVTVTSLDVANIDSTGVLPITLAANGDIYGLADLLRHIRSARFAVVVDKLQAQNNSALRGAPDVLQFALSLHAPVIIP